MQTIAYFYFNDEVTNNKTIFCKLSRLSTLKCNSATFCKLSCLPEALKSELRLDGRLVEASRGEYQAALCYTVLSYILLHYII